MQVAVWPTQAMTGERQTPPGFLNNGYPMGCFLYGKLKELCKYYIIAAILCGIHCICVREVFVDFFFFTRHPSTPTLSST